MSDLTDNPSHEYHLRSKRRKLTNGEEYTTPCHFPKTSKRKSPIRCIPFEILQRIFTYISYKELSDSVRTVNQRFKLVVEDLLNKDFRSFQNRLGVLTSQTFKILASTNDDTETKCLCSLLNMLDIITFQHSVTMATIRPYVYHGSKSNCMYAGLILDVYKRFFQKFIAFPYHIYGTTGIKDSALPDEVESIILLTKIFCVHFDKVIEESSKYSLLPGAGKIVDLLDCGIFAKKTVISEKATDLTFSAKYSYNFKNAWFLSFKIIPDASISVTQKQRIMYMRIRRIILAHSEMFMRQYHYEREMLLRGDRSIKKPGIIAYTGYGDAENMFFYYGSMNDSAYEQKFQITNFDEETESNEQLSSVDAANEQNLEFAGYLGLNIDVWIECPRNYAPYNFLKINQTSNATVNSDGKFSLTVRFNCPGAEYVRLPDTYEYSRNLSKIPETN